MDFGFGDVLKMFEDYFGRRVTAGLLVLVGLAIAGTCLSVIWTWVINPLLVFLDTPLWGQSLASIFWRIGGIIIGVTLGLAWAHDLVRFRRTRQLKKDIAAARRTISEAAATNSNVKTALNQSRAVLESSIVLALSLLEMDETLTDDQLSERLEKIREADDVLKSMASDEA